MINLNNTENKKTLEKVEQDFNQVDGTCDIESLELTHKRFDKLIDEMSSDEDYVEVSKNFYKSLTKKVKEDGSIDPHEGGDLFPIICLDCGDISYHSNFLSKKLLKLLFAKIGIMTKIGLEMTTFPTIPDKEERVSFVLDIDDSRPVNKSKDFRIPIKFVSGFKTKENKTRKCETSKELVQVFESLKQLVDEEFGTAIPNIRIFVGNHPDIYEDMFFVDILDVGYEDNGVIKPREDMNSYIPSVLSSFIKGCKLMISYIVV